MIFHGKVYERKRLAFKPHGKRPIYDKEFISSRYGSLCIKIMEQCWHDESNEKRLTFSKIKI